MRDMRLDGREAAEMVDALHSAGIVGEYDKTEMRPYTGAAYVGKYLAKNDGGKFEEARRAWNEAKAECLQILGMEKEPARGWWMALDRERRAAVMRAEVVPFCHVSAAWDELPASARAKLTAQHDKRRATWAKLNAEFSGRVSV